MIKKLQLKYYFSLISSFLSLGICIVLAGSCHAPAPEIQIIIEPEISQDISSEAPVVSLTEESDLIINSYLDPALREKVIAFFEELTGSWEIAAVILVNAAAYNVAPSLAFSLCAEESSFNPQAINRNRNNTIDRGLFQLNNASFPDIKILEFYDIEVNARYGMSHLRWCLDTAGTDVAALAMYNAGTARVNAHGTPRQTLDYVSRILNRQMQIERLFLAEYPDFLVVDIAEEPQKTPFRLKLLTPLGGR